MKNSKDKEHRISNLKDMIRNIKTDEVENKESADDFDDIPEDTELINYYYEDKINFDELEVDDEYIYYPGKEKDYAVDLDENNDNIDEKFIIKTEITEDYDEINGVSESEEEVFDDFIVEGMENIDTYINSISTSRTIPLLSTIIGIIILLASAYIFNSRSDRIIDNVVSGETSFIVVILLIMGSLLLIYGIYKLFAFRNPFEKISNSIESVEKEEKEKEDIKSKKEEKIIPKSKIPLDKESYKIGEFNMNDLKPRLKKNNTPKNLFKEDLSKIPPAKEKTKEKKELTPQEREYERAKLDYESIDEIFSKVDDIDE